jgi:hypothetical protein
MTNLPVCSFQLIPDIASITFSPMFQRVTEWGGHVGEKKTKLPSIGKILAEVNYFWFYSISRKQWHIVNNRLMFIKWLCCGKCCFKHCLLLNNLVVITIPVGKVLLLDSFVVYKNNNKLSKVTGLAKVIQLVCIQVIWF